MSFGLSHVLAVPSPLPQTRAPQSASWRPCLLLALWFGILTGGGEVLLLGIKKFLLHQPIFMGPHILWLAPLAEALLFTLLGLVLACLTRRWALPRTMQLATAVFTFCGFLSGLFMYTPLSPYAAAILAAGLGVQSGRLVARHAATALWFVQRTLGWLVVLVVMLGVGVPTWLWFTERQALAALPPAPAGAPNVLFITLDTVRAQNLSVYGYPRPTTPQLEQLARHGVRFDNAMSTSPWTLPAHASMFTGRLAHELSTNWTTALDTTYPTLAEVLRAQGYQTAGFVANTFFCAYEFGLQRGFIHYEDYTISLEELLFSSTLGRTLAYNGTLRRWLGIYEVLTRKNAAMLNQDFLHWLAQRQEQRPFLAFINYFDAHEPYLPPTPFRERFGTHAIRQNFRIEHVLRRGLVTDRQTFSAAEKQAEVDAYDNAITYLDHHLGLLFTELERRGLLANTLIVLTADHGELFGEHGLFLHGNSLYLPLLHVPLLMVHPGKLPAGRTVSQPVSLRDLPSTILDILALPAGHPFPGQSLAPYWQAPLDQRNADASPALFAEVRQATWGKEWYPTVQGDMQTVLNAQHQYIQNSNGQEELFDLHQDPFQERNLSATADMSQTLQHFRAVLETMRSTTVRKVP